jgi:hypothetical protein
MQRELKLRQRIRALTTIFIVGLVISGATAIPVVPAVDWLVNVSGAKELVRPGGAPAASRAEWLTRVQASLHSVADHHPFLFYGTDWLAFGHFVIALAFTGAIRDPVRNNWLFTFGMIACVLVVPYALIFGAIRGIPMWWRLIDCSFGVAGIIPLWLCRIWSRELEARQTG